MNELTIPYKNIYHMLVYAIEYINLDVNRKHGIELLEASPMFYAKILSLCCNKLFKKEGVARYEQIKTIGARPRGHIDFDKSIYKGLICSDRLAYTYSKISNDTDVNRVIKCALILLLKEKNIKRDKEMCKALRKIINNNLSSVINLEPKEIDFKNIDITMLSKEYKTAYTIAMATIKNIIAKEKDTGASIKFQDAKSIEYIFETFIREFYNKKLKKTHKVERTKFKGDGIYPKGETDATLVKKKSHDVVILDAKWITAGFDKDENSYKIEAKYANQIITYCVKYIDEIDRCASVVGILVCAATDNLSDSLKSKINSSEPKELLDGNIRYCERIIDLNQEFNCIENELIQLLSSF